MKRSTLIAISLTVCISILLALSCQKDKQAPFVPQEEIIEEIAVDPVFKAEKNKFAMELDSVIQHFSNMVEEIDLKLYDHGDEMQNELKVDYTILKMDIEKYVKLLEVELTKVEGQTENNWEDFKLETRNRTKETKLEFRQMKLKMKESFQK